MSRLSSLQQLNSKLAHFETRKAGFARALKECASLSGEPDNDTYSHLLKLCYKEKLFNESRALFSEINNPTNEHWNQLISTAITSNQKTSLVSSLLEKMRQSGFNISSRILDELVALNTRKKSLEGSLKVLQEYSEEVQPSYESIGKIVTLAAQSASPRLAFEIAFEFEASSPRSLTVDTWMTILRSCAYYHYMPGIEHAWTIVVSENSSAVDEGTCLLVLNACARQPNPQLATWVISSLKSQHIPLQEHHLAPVIQAYAATGNLKEAFPILGIMRQNKIQPQLETALPILDNISKSIDNVDEAYYLLHDLNKQGEAMDVSAVNVIISACVKLGDMHRALSTFQEIDQFKVKPSTETYNILLSGCIDGSNRSLGDKLLTMMKKQNVQPDARTFERLIILCLTQTAYEDAFFYLEEMKGAGYIPPQSVYETLIRRCYSLEPHLYRRDSSLSVNSTQKETLIVACVYAVVIGILWHVPFLRWLIYPFKLLTVGFHEFSHALAGKLTGAKIESIRLDPHEGGETRMRGGWSFISLPAGFLFDLYLLGQKGLAVLPLDYHLLSATCSVLVHKSWYIPPLCYIVHRCNELFNDTLIRKVASSDAVQMSYAFKCIPSRGWGFIWLLQSVGFFACGIIVGIAAFKYEDQRARADMFLST
ncbi:hypothetical protein E3Q23_00730 [Wallemia mellicola]|uniref:Pentatricopeptide repeat-containing protein-mitochondrial domain-containing protein n=1 Tax=Wallemia mellicola TaxID=1708541 RepID=A0A4T0M6W7_9BASI|nr:hypothetical protein E3Q23_00730 [Wallemia mellicola]TIC69716.1 hypothetical protein E3Q01_00257 [Wallemia mellicola]